MTRHAYLFIYDDDAGAREEIRGYIDKLPEILNWRCDMPHAFYLVSECSAREIAEKIRAFTRDEGRFLISEVTGNKQGWLPKRTWRLLNEKPLPEQEKSANRARS